MKVVSCIVAIVFIVGCWQQEEAPRIEYENESYFVHLQDGFSGENVQILVDGHTHYDGRPTTNILHSFADEFTGSVRSKIITVTILIPKENFESTHHIDLSKARGIGISIVNGNVGIRQANAFGYD